MCRQKKVFSVTCLVVFGFFVLAAGQLVAAETPWFVGAKFGQAENNAQFGSRHPKSIDDEAGASALEVGYTLNRHLAIQIGYHDLGSHQGTGSPCRQTDESCIERLALFQLCAEGTECTRVVVPLNSEMSGFSLALEPRWPLSERFALLGKVGLMAWDTDINPHQFGPIERFSGEDLVAGLGVLYQLPSGLGLLLEYEELDLEVSSTNFGIRWRF